MARSLAVYPLDNADPLAARHHELLSALLDPFTVRRIAGLLDVRGKRCLDVGAGGGSISSWLADRVGEDGYVVATDTKPEHLPEHPRLETLRHDLVGDPVPAGTFDLIHARLVLNHLPQRREILSRLVASLAPGGTILLEDWDASRTDMVLAAPDAAVAALYTKFQETLGGKVFAAAGTDRTWARQVFSALRDEGLGELSTAVEAQSWVGGGDGCQMVIGSIGQLRDHLLAVGMTDDELDELAVRLADPSLALLGHLMYSTSGRKPLR